MPRAEKAKSNTQALVVANWDQPEATNITPRSVTPETLAQHKWYRDLSDDEKDRVKSEGQGLALALAGEIRSKMAVGQHLHNIQQILEPHSSFLKFLKQYNFRQRTAYRRIEAFKHAAAILPSAVIQVAAIKNVDLLGTKPEQPLGRYTHAVEVLPPPKNPTPDQADKYVTEIVAKEKELRKKGGKKATVTPITRVPSDPHTLLKESFRLVRSRYRALPNNAKTRQNFIASLVGMLLADNGSTGKQTFAPVPVPTDFGEGRRGRPKKLAVQ